MPRRTKIIATLGPATDDDSEIEKLKFVLDAGPEEIEGSRETVGVD